MTQDKQQDLLDDLDDFEYEMQNILEEIRTAVKDYKTTSNLEDWKKKVIQSLPQQCSMATRIKIEEFLETIKE